MSSSTEVPIVNEISENGSVQTARDPFDNQIPVTPEQRRTSHRFSSFDTQLFSTFQPSSSPSQAKRALESHLAETDRRLEEASRLGTSLIQQRRDLSDRLKEVDSQKDEREIGPDLRQKLIEIEKEYNDLGKDSARAFLAPKSRLASAEENANGSTTVDPIRTASPTKFMSQATDSPSKVNVPSRKQRNQPGNRVHDIEFATEISTSLLNQVRQLQTVLAEKDESLKTLTLEKSQLELDAQGYTQRLRNMDENEQRYRDENWSLETQTHDLMAAAKEGSSREQKLQHSLALITAEKSTAQRELDDIKSAHGKLNEEHTTLRKFHDTEIAGLRKNASLAETDRGTLERKIDELTSQNQELARALAGRMKAFEEPHTGNVGSEPEDFSLDRSDIEHSPPPSPTKGPARNSMLEQETLKSSLHHAHRMIQTLKGNVHREKGEKLELKRLLQEARDELEVRRSEASNGNKKIKAKSQQDLGKKGSKLGQLGAGRHSRTDVEMNDQEWEDHNVDPMLKRISASRGVGDINKSSDTSDAYHTANETEDAFETANENENNTESEAFQTGAESLAGDSSDDLTETESGPTRQDTVRGNRDVSSSTIIPNKRASIISTASASDGDEDREVKTPVQSSFSSLKYRLRMGRGSRRSRMGSEEPEGTPRSSRDSPASFISNKGPKGQSLAAELGDFGDSGDELEGAPSGTLSRTPSRNVSQKSTPARASLVSSPPPSVPKIPMVDSGMMTEPWEAPSQEQALAAPLTIPSTPKKMQDQGIQGSSLVQSTIPVQYQSQDAAVQRSPAVEPSPVRDIPATPAGITHSSDTRMTPNTADLLSQVAPSQELTFAGAATTSSPPPVLSNPELTFSDIRSVQTAPRVFQQDKERPATAIYSQGETISETDDQRHGAIEAASAGVMGSVFGWAMGKRQSTAQIAEDETAEEPKEASPSPSGKVPFKELSTNLMQRSKDSPDRASPASKTVNIDKTDQSSQTLLSSDYIEGLLSKSTKPTIVGGTVAGSTISPNGTKMRELTRDIPPPAKSARRPGSSSSIRASNIEVPPLPSDHRQAIEAASQRGSINDRVEGSMGPPLAPASAYRASARRPITPAEQTTGPRIVTTPTSQRHRYSSARSGRSRRSSVSSFESEIDARFNIRADGMPVPAVESGTDPRMIQAITQTMIGEYLWKYTRKAGRGEMSTNRHRRFCWVHPYTRTLYWSDQDPSTAGRAQLKAKSVAIEAIRVVADDNPLPPGLHRKSIVVITPGREIKFTATTGQRHETWFNAMSYLLLRSAPDAQYADITQEDIAEFNPRTGAYNRGTAASRTSLSTYNSRTNTTRQSRASSRAESPTKSSVHRSSHAIPQNSTASRYSNTKNASVASRFSSYWKPTRSSEAPAREDNRASAASSGIYDVSVVNDSAEDVRQVLEKQDDEADRLENVRACCDGRSSMQCHFDSIELT